MDNVTTDCPICVHLRDQLSVLTAQHREAEKHTDMESDEWTEGLVHPNKFLGVLAERVKHEKKTGHVTLSSAFLSSARAKVKTYGEAEPASKDFWAALAQRFLVPTAAEA